MVDQKIYQTFKRGSKTFFTSSLFFPRAVREDVFIFYAFVRIADDFVDSIPARFDAFNVFKSKYVQALRGFPAQDTIIDSFAGLVAKRSIPPEWMESFLAAMTSDTYKKTYATLAELEEYIYGSAEVIGLVMAKLMNLPAESYATARLLGKGFQYINFIRDIAEDIQLGRQYIPLEVLRPFGFEKLTETTAREKPDQFKALIKQELSRYRAWQTDGEAGFSYIPKRALLPIKTAADMYRFTADVIEKDPFVIFRKKVKPTKLKIIWQLFLNLL